MSLAGGTVTGTDPTSLVAALTADKIGVKKVSFSNIGSADGYLILLDGTTERTRKWAPAASGPYEFPVGENGLVIPLGSMTAATAFQAKCDAGDVSFRVDVVYQARHVF